MELLRDHDLDEELDISMEDGPDDAQESFYMSLDEEGCEWDEDIDDLVDPLKGALDELADRGELIATLNQVAPVLTELAHVRFDLERAAMQREDLMPALRR